MITHEGEHDLIEVPEDPRARHYLQAENGPPLEASAGVGSSEEGPGGAGSCEGGPGEAGSGEEGYWDDLDEEGISGRVALFLANLRSRSNITFSLLNFVVGRTTDLIGDIVEHLQSKTMALLSTLGHAHSLEVDNLKQELFEIGAGGGDGRA